MAEWFNPALLEETEKHEHSQEHIRFMRQRCIERYCKGDLNSEENKRMIASIDRIYKPVAVGTDDDQPQQ